MSSTGPRRLSPGTSACGAPSAAGSPAFWAAGGPSRPDSATEFRPRATLVELLSPRFDRLVTRVFHCPETRALSSARRIDPGATLLTDWSDFARAFPNADVNVLLSVAPGVDDLADRLSALAGRHRLPSVIVVTHVDIEHVLAFRRAPVDEFVPLASAARDFPEAVLRSVINPLRERLALYLERLDHGGPELRFALARVLRQPNRIRTIQQLAASEGITVRTLEKQWKAMGGGADEVRLEDLLWMIRLLEALELRGKGASLCRIAQELEVDLRTLQRAGQRHLGGSLGRVSRGEVTTELLELRRRLLGCLRRVEPGRRERQIPTRSSGLCATEVQCGAAMLGDESRAFARGRTS